MRLVNGCRVELDRKEYVELRRLFFKQVEQKSIEKKTGLKLSVVYRISKENNWRKKRDRYYRFVCWFAYKNNTSIYKECKRLGLDRIWLQPGSESEAAITFCHENNLKVVHDTCVMMN